MFYNYKVHGLINFFSFASNLYRLNSVLWLLKASCALTLARKYKLRTMSKVFRKFGTQLKCPETDAMFYKPKNLKPIHDFKKNIVTDPGRILVQNWPGKDTKSILNEVCTICSTSSKIEMHHIKSVKNIRTKYRAGNKVTYAELKGAIIRKQVPLCAYHHHLYHKGKLNYSDLAIIARYRKAYKPL
jgi:hypothetical protein